MVSVSDFFFGIAAGAFMTAALQGLLWLLLSKQTPLQMFLAARRRKLWIKQCYDDGEEDLDGMVGAQDGEFMAWLALSEEDKKLVREYQAEPASAVPQLEESACVEIDREAFFRK